MDYEKKLALAKEALDSGSYDKETIEYIFPELKESENERIRKEIIAILKYKYEHYPKDPKYRNAPQWIAWLEKQGDKVSAIEGFETEFERQVSHLIASAINREHEYNEGYVKWTATALLNFAKHELEKQGEQKSAEVEPKFKVGDFIANDYCFGKVVALTNDAYLLDTEQGIPFSCEHNAHLWTIQDAKDGDVLCCESGWTCIFRALDNHTNTFSSYCFMDSDKWFCNTGCTCHTLDEQFIRAYNFKLHPATKEQRDLLFQKMKEAGYEWDADKKELKKIEQKPAWSEEDEYCIHQLIVFCENCMIQDSGAKRCADWLKSLKPQNTWKPSEEQMRVLDLAIKCGINRGTTEETTLVSLFNDLKKLKG